MVSYRGRVAPNRIDRPGTAEEAWDGWVELKRLPVADPLGWPSAVIVAAHPDDEILGAGGTLARLAAGGTRLRLVAVTDGEASHPETDPRATARRRTAESEEALRLLGVRDIEVIRLCFPDTGLIACEDELSGRLGELCDGFGVCLAPWEQDADDAPDGFDLVRCYAKGETCLYHRPGACSPAGGHFLIPGNQASVERALARIGAKPAARLDKNPHAWRPPQQR